MGPQGPPPRPGHPAIVDLRDDMPLASGGRAYLAADATRDSDGDGLPDEIERRVYGTSPYLADTDGDGLGDALELAWGFDPAVSDQPPWFSFRERFEAPEVVPGPLDGQHGWTAGSDSAEVQRETVFEGEAALALGLGEASVAGGVSAERQIDCSASEVWVDARVYCTGGSNEIDADPDVFAAASFDRQGHPMATDGCSVRTNAEFAAAGWRRRTATGFPTGGRLRTA